MNFGDLRSACHEGTDAIIRDALWAFDGPADVALMYVRDQRPDADTVTKWRCDGKVYDGVMGAIKDREHLRLDGCARVGAHLYAVVTVDAGSMIYQKWALEHVRKPVFDKVWRPWFEENKAQDSIRANDLLIKLLEVHHPAYINGDMIKKQWDATRDAVWDAAWDATWNIAREAAWLAARGAAWNAARDAAWLAARGAAWDTARDSVWGEYAQPMERYIKEHGRRAY